MNWFVGRIYANKDIVRHRILGHFLNMSSVNVFDASFWWLPTRIKDT